MTEIKVPPLGESIVEATISRWLKREGEAVAAGETVVELETDKVTVEVPATTSGVLVRRAHQEGDVVTLGTVLAEVDETAKASATQAAQPAPQAAQPAPVPASSPPAEPAAAPAPHPTPAPATADGEVRASPAARRLAVEEGVDLSTVQGTGRGGVVSKPDVIEQSQRPGNTGPGMPQPAVEVTAPPPVMPSAPARPTAAAAKAPPAPPPAATDGARETREKMSTRRKRIAEHLLESQHATAHLTTFNEIDMSSVESLRGRVKERIEKEHGVRLSFMPFFARAACLALKQFPMVNARIDGDSIIYHHYVNLGIAVASDAGLVVPNVKDADRKGMIQVGRDIAEVAKKARDGKLVMDDLTGGTFTITNGGVFGSLLSTPIINFPQVGILGLHKIQDRAVVIDGKVEVRPMMYVALSYDHRIIDGQQAVLFLVRIKELMEDPALLAID
jgi:2-oxoglutarate dehydrogenase E2 component (dihydrolipoamide succinyltransferase)